MADAILGTLYMLPVLACVDGVKGFIRNIKSDVLTTASKVLKSPLISNSAYCSSLTMFA